MFTVVVAGPSIVVFSSLLDFNMQIIRQRWNKPKLKIINSLNHYLLKIWVNSIWSVSKAISAFPEFKKWIFDWK